MFGKFYTLKPNETVLVNTVMQLPVNHLGRWSNGSLGKVYEAILCRAYQYSTYWYSTYGHRSWCSYTVVRDVSFASFLPNR